MSQTDVYLTKGEHQLLERLSQGELLCSQYAGYAMSAESLKVRVLRLRKKGIDIRTRRWKDVDKLGKPGAYYLPADKS